MSKTSDMITDIIVEDILKDYSRTTNVAVFTFGRFQPITIGHKKLIDRVIELGRSYHADYFIFASKTEDKDKNPLAYESKIRFLKEIAGPANIMDIFNIKNPFDAAYWLRDKGYDNVIFVAGSDRVASYKANFKPYINHEDPEKSFNFKEFDVVTAGFRDPDSNDIEGISATNARKSAMAGNWESFRRMVPLEGTSAMSMYRQVRRGLGLES